MENNKRMCASCGEEMHRVGTFASVKVEGQPAAKHDGSCPYECINENCPSYQEVVTFSFEEEVAESMRQLCQCGHARTCHGYSLSQVHGMSETPKYDKDGKCSVDKCECQVFVRAD